MNSVETAVRIQNSSRLEDYRQFAESLVLYRLSKMDSSALM